MRLPTLALAAAFGAALLQAAPAHARVTGLDIQHREDVLQGRSFGAAGAYEWIQGRVHFAVRPDDPANREIVDLALAPRNAQGEVEFSADVYLIKPKDMARGNGSVLCEIPNRGGKALLPLFNHGTGSLAPRTAADFGDGFLLQRGYTLAWVGWQADPAPGATVLRLYSPIAHAPDGSHLTGLVRADFTPWKPETTWPLAHIITGRVGGTGYPALVPNDPGAVLTVRDLPHGPRTVIPRAEWTLSREAVSDSAGFAKGRIYEVVYHAQDPRVAGLGFAATRDFLAYAKYDPAAVIPVKRVYALGISQTARFLRHFLYQGFNADERGRQVMDGVLAHVGGAGRGSFNFRFAQPSRDSEPMTSIDFPADLFPFTDLPETDPVTGERAGLLDRAAAEKVLPKIFLSHTSYEYWGRSASLIQTTADGASDTSLSPNVRIYFFAGLQHFSGPFPPVKGLGELRGQHPMVGNPITWLWRAMLVNMDRWVKGEALPPDSRYPTLAAGTLIAPSALRFPAIPGVKGPPVPVTPYHLDYGPQWSEGIITRDPPVEGAPYAIRVPQADEDGNDRGGVDIPEIAVPLASYPAWNLRDPSIGAPTQAVSFEGSYLPFPRTAADRQATHDPRRSTAERYSDEADYLRRYRAAAEACVRDGFLLEEDVPAIVTRGDEEWKLATSAPNP